MAGGSRKRVRSNAWASSATGGANTLQMGVGTTPQGGTTPSRPWEGGGEGFGGFGRVGPPAVGFVPLGKDRMTS